MEQAQRRHETDPIPDQREDSEALALRLEATGDYKVLRRLNPRQPAPPPAGHGSKVGIVIDLETAGLDPSKDEIIEVAMVKFRYSSDGVVAGVIDTFQAFNQPSAPIPPEVVDLTGITDEMVAGAKVDAKALAFFIADAKIVIAHNAGFDRKFAERCWALFEHKHWACSATEVEWQKLGFSGAKLGYLLAESGLFHDTHRALDDCYATLEILALRLPATSTTALAALLDRARRKTFRISAENSPYAFKDELKRRRYRWNDGADGRLRSWHIDVDEDKLESELSFLRKEIYQRDIDIDYREITALNRFSDRA
jgi:DNA polymerase III subunit epsilon